MENQFAGLKHNEIDPKKEYYCSPATQSCEFTVCMKHAVEGAYGFIRQNLNLIQNNTYFNNTNILNTKNKKGWTALMLACRNSNTTSNNETVKILLENKADVNLKDDHNWTALMLACRNSNTTSNNETVKLLLDYKADVDSKDNDKLTALMLACRNVNTDSNIETVKLLLDYKADINLRCNSGVTALMYLCNNSNTDINNKIIKLFLDANADCDKQYIEKYISKVFNTNDNTESASELMKSFKTYCDLRKIIIKLSLL